MIENRLTETDFNGFVLANMPYFIAVNYQRLLAAQTPQERIELTLHTYNLGLRVLTIGLVSQYLIRDKDRVRDSYLNELLLQKFPRLTLDAWLQIFFASLRAYEGNEALFFIPELYNFYWDTSITPHRRRTEVEYPFSRLTQIAIERQTKRLLPQNEAEWEHLATETLDLLQQILRYWVFIGWYDLIRVLNYDEQFYDFELHKGITISIGHQPMPKQVQFSRGWFYLRKETAGFLLLHPFLVFWEDEVENSGLIADTGVYDRFIYEHSLQYLLAMLGKTITDNRSVTTFVTLLYDTIEEAKRKRQESDKLTWWHLRDLCADITRQRMSTVRHKYRSELYLQRDKTYQAFEKFLVSDKRCFVLVGKSGVGKSNFLLALDESLQQSQDTLCLLIYDGAHLKVGSSVTEVIDQDFNDRLILAGRKVKQIWRELAQIESIEQCRVVLCVDAINENSQAKELLRQLDELVQRPWPWLKVVFSSRPETWRAIKRGVRLTEALYYREEGSEMLEVELEPFSYSEQMEPFSRQELPAAYAKYQQVFRLQTQYEALPSELRKILRDPLNLWLVAKTYTGQVIPTKLKVTELISQYVDALLRSERLQETDLRLLEKQLVPLMVKEGHYSNTIAIADIDAAGGGLYDVIYSEQLLSDGQHLNQSFANLMDTDILVRQAEGREQKITFKHERLYEYFVGRRITELSDTQIDRLSFFKGMISKTTEIPFLWGAVKNALVQDLKDCGPETTLALCLTDQQRVKEMMVSTLIDFGRDNKAEVETIIKHLLSPQKRMSRLHSIWHFLGKVNVKTDVYHRNAGKIAIEVASNLGIASALQIAAMQADPTIRTVAVRYIYYLWQRDSSIGFEILESLAQNAVPGLIPNLTTFEVVLGLSLAIFLNHSGEQQVCKQLQGIWRKMIVKLLAIQVSKNRLGNLLREFIRERVFAFAIITTFRLLGEFEFTNHLNYLDLQAFFKLGVTEKALYKRLTQYLDPQGNYSKKQMEEDFLAVLKIRNLLILVVTTYGLTAHMVHAPLAFFPFLKKFYEEAQKDAQPSPYLHEALWALGSVLDLNSKAPQEIFDFFVHAMKINQDPPEKTQQ